jgi:hypothetical protein
MGDDQFYSREHTSYWTYTEVKTQSLNWVFFMNKICYYI